MSFHSTRRLICQGCIEGTHHLCRREACFCPCQEPDFKAWSAKVREFLADAPVTDYTQLALPLLVDQPHSHQAAMR